MHTVVETPSYLSDARAAGMSDALRAEVVTLLAKSPSMGDLLVGTGGLRKFRIAREGKGKSGGFRVLAYYHSADYPVFLVAMFGKNQRDNLSPAERNAIGKALKTMATKYRMEEPK